jgi:soluble lytic murein transglycosylase-like protein
MKRSPMLAWLIAMAALTFPQIALAGNSQYDALISAHAQANGVPEALVHRVIVRESRYQPHLVGRGGTIGLMQIKLATARGLGYTGDAAGLRDPNTNLTYAVKYLAGAYRAANGDHDRAVHYYAAGYYQAAKRQRVRVAVDKQLEWSSNPQPLAGTVSPAAAPRKRLAKNPADANAQVPRPPASVLSRANPAKPR